jgi:hypothetical protein
MAKDRYERRHRRTAKNRHCIEVMANANFDAVPSLSEAMGLEEPAGPEVVDCRQHGNVPARVAALLDAGCQAAGNRAGAVAPEDDLPF